MDSYRPSAARREGPSPAARDRGDSLAYATALEIERDIIRRDLPGGVLVGSCRTLAGRYGVGRQAVGEAVRIVEARGLACMRPGRHGGLVVAGPVVEWAATWAAKALALAVQLDGGQVSQARANLGAACLWLACAQPDTVAPRLVRWFLTSASPTVGDARGRSDFLLALAAITGNGPALLFSSLAAALTPPPPSTITGHAAADLRGRQGAIIAAVTQGDAAEAQAQLLDYMTATALLCAPGVTEIAADDLAVSPRTRAGQIAHAILRDLTARRAAGQTCDGVLGNIDALCDNHQTCRATAVQALRLLETSGVISVRSGRGQGYSLRPSSTDRVLAQLTDVLADRPGAREASFGFLTSLNAAGDLPVDNPILCLAQQTARAVVSAPPDSRAESARG